MLNRQGRQTATGESFTANRVASLRQHWKIPSHQPPATPPEGELLTVQAAADQLDVSPSTLLRWLMDGFIGGEQVTPGAPWRIRLTQQLKDLIVAQPRRVTFRCPKPGGGWGFRDKLLCNE